VDLYPEEKDATEAEWQWDEEERGFVWGLFFCGLHPVLLVLGVLLLLPRYDNDGALLLTQNSGLLALAWGLPLSAWLGRRRPGLARGFRRALILVAALTLLAWAWHGAMRLCCPEPGV